MGMIGDVKVNMNVFENFLSRFVAVPVIVCSQHKGLRFGLLNPCSFYILSPRYHISCQEVMAFIFSDQLDVLFVVVNQWIFHIWKKKQTTNMRHVKFNSSMDFLSDHCTRHSLCATWTPATWTDLDLNNFQLHLPVVTCRWLAWLAATYLPFHRFLRLPIQSIACMYSPKRT